ncbi:MAG: Zn-dependent hydrolase [Pseudomonadota bacterium]
MNGSDKKEGLELKAGTGESGPRLAVNLERLKARLTALSAIGADPSGQGLQRLSFSAADFEARHWLAEQMAAIGLRTHLDAVGNVIGRWEVGRGPAVLVGSHLDSVPNGGAFDGALGVVAALECVEALMERGMHPAAPIEVIGTSEEEGRFGGMLGAQAMAGVVPEAWFFAAQDDGGVKLTDAMRRAGLDPNAYPTARRDPKEVKAFLELHIEQGPVLEHRGLPVGIVEGISGVFNWTVVLTGRANHAGTTPMELRRDAFSGLAQFASEIPGILAQHGTSASRLTVGKVGLQPNFPHTVPGRAEFSIVGRDVEEPIMAALAAACRAALGRTAAHNGLDLTIDETSWLSPTPCHGDIVAAFKRQATALGLEAPVMPSGAGHDTQMMARLAPSGMIFVASKGGISHAPDEHSEWPDIEAGANLLLHTLLDVAQLGT